MILNNIQQDLAKFLRVIHSHAQGGCEQSCLMLTVSVLRIEAVIA
nr:hypothetical protein [Chamaesiphon sp. VAR_69_metabat_338]